MTEPEMERILGSMRELWSKWNPTPVQAKLWKRALLPVSVEHAETAVYLHKESSQRNEPSVAKFREALAVDSGFQGQFRAVSGQVGYSNVFVHREDYSHLQEMIYASPEDIPDRETVWKAAETVRLKCEELYGKKYVISQDQTWRQMEERKRCYREQHGMAVDGSWNAEEEKALPENIVRPDFKKIFGTQRAQLDRTTGFV